MDDTRLPMASDPSPSLANRPTLDIEDNPLHTISTAGVTNQDVSARYVQDVSSLIGYGRHNGASIGELAAQFFAHWERFDATNQAATVHAAQLTPHGDGWKQCAANHYRRDFEEGVRQQQLKNLLVMDPFDGSDNIARNLDENRLEYVQKAFRQAKAAFWDPPRSLIAAYPVRWIGIVQNHAIK